MAEAALERILRRDRVIVGMALVLLTVLAWSYVLWLAVDMDMGGMDMTGFRIGSSRLGIIAPAHAPWRLIEFAFVFVMWVLMMVGMMAPSATPMILMYTRAGRQAAASRTPFAPTGWFVAGYFLAWTAFSLVATLVQWVLERWALLDSSMASASQTLGGIVLIAAGAYQWSPLKDVCLTQCQTPLTFLMRHGGFRRDAPGCLLLGLRHGAYCIGCCWALMALLFVVGAMNVLWIAGLAILILLEKSVPGGRFPSRALGLVLVVAWAIFLYRTRM